MSWIRVGNSPSLISDVEHTTPGSGLDVSAPTGFKLGSCRNWRLCYHNRPFRGTNLLQKRKSTEAHDLPSTSRGDEQLGSTTSSILRRIFAQGTCALHSSFPIIGSACFRRGEVRSKQETHPLEVTSAKPSAILVTRAVKSVVRCGKIFLENNLHLLSRVAIFRLPRCPVGSVLHGENVIDLARETDPLLVPVAYMTKNADVPIGTIPTTIRRLVLHHHMREGPPFRHRSNAKNSKSIRRPLDTWSTSRRPLHIRRLQHSVALVPDSDRDRLHAVVHLELDPLTARILPRRLALTAATKVVASVIWLSRSCRLGRLSRIG